MCQLTAMYAFEPMKVFVIEVANCNGVLNWLIHAIIVTANLYTHSKVAQFDMTQRINKNIWWFNVYTYKNMTIYSITIQLHTSMHYL